MKKINKTEPPVLFIDFVRKNNPNNWSDCVEIISELRKHILSKEQDGQCAYCESAITSEKSNPLIDHFRRKTGHLFPELFCNYENLLVSCDNPYHCAHHKDNKIRNKNDYDNLINPALHNPSLHFDYSYTGDILPKNEKGRNTIEIFNLNHRSLIERRIVVALYANSYKSQMDIEEIKNQFTEFSSFIESICKS